MITFSIKALVEDLLDGLFRRFQGVLLPRLSIIRTENNNLTLLTPKGRKVWHFNNHRPIKERENRS